MNYSIQFSKLATEKLADLTKYLDDEWSVRVKLNFIKKLNEKVAHILIYPESSVSLKVSRTFINASLQAKHHFSIGSTMML